MTLLAALDHEWRCLCGGHAYTLDQLIALSDDEWARYWPSVMGPFDFYCSDDDEVLTDEEVWRVRGLKVPVHDEDEGLLAFPDDMVLTP